jgi:outer membrane immunogenic protein
MNRTLTAALIFSALSASAFAADLTHVPPPAPVFTWTGFYAGVNAGVAWQDGSGSYFQPLSPGFGATKFNNAGVIGGGQLGYDWQNGTFVFGIVADIDGLSARASGTVSPFAAVPADLVTLTQRQDWLGTVRSRVGVTFGNALLYGTGGLAAGGTNHSFTQFVTTTPAQTVTTSSSTTRTGWALGAGIEYAIAKNWSIGVEYLHVDLGKSTLVQPATSAGGLAFSISQATFTDRSDIVRATINWRFGG